MAAGVPLIVDPWGHHRFTAARFCFAAALLTIGLIVCRRGFVVDRLVARAWVVALAVATLATVLAVDPLQSLLGDPTRLMGLLGLMLGFLGFMLGGAAGPTALTPVLAALLGGAALVTLGGLGQFVVDGGRPTATLGNAGFLGAFLCLVLPIALAGAMARPPWRLPLAALGAGAATLLLVTTTRGAWIGAAVGVAVVVVLRWRRAWPALAVAGVIALALALPVRDRNTTQGRVDTWRQSLDVVAARPVLGWGPDNVRTGLAQELDDAWVARYTLDQIPDRAHNRFLDIAASTGVIGLVADVALLVAAGVSVRRSLRGLERGSPAWWGVAGIAGGLTGYLVQGQFLFDTFDLALVAWVLVGVAAASGSAPATRNVPSRTVVKLAAASIVLVAFGVANFAADRLVQSASGTSAPQQIDALTRAADVRPRALDTYLLAAAVAKATPNPDVARRAHALLHGWKDPYVQLRDADVLSWLGRLTHDRGTSLRSIALYESALRRAPTNGPGWLGLGVTRLAIGDEAGGRVALRRAEELMPGKVEPLAQAGTG